MTLLNKGAFCWNQETTKVFEKLKEVVCMTPILTTLDLEKKSILECDASSHGIGAFLKQEGRCLSFESSLIK